MTHTCRVITRLTNGLKHNFYVPASCGRDARALITDHPHKSKHVAHIVGVQDVGTFENFDRDSSKGRFVA